MFVHVCCIQVELGISQCSSVNDAFDEDSIIDDEASIFQLLVGDEAGAPTGHVHIGFWLLKVTAHGIGLEGVDDIAHSCLIEQLECDLVGEGPL